ncbi:MAG: CapA family protein [Clostridium sp.]
MHNYFITGFCLMRKTAGSDRIPSLPPTNDLLPARQHLLPRRTPAATGQTRLLPRKTKKKEAVTEITISAAGDGSTLGSDYKSPASVNFYAKYKQKTPSYFFKNVKNIFKKDDLTLVNFEGTLTTRSTRADKTFAFKGNPSYLKILQKGNVDAISFANNHCRDFGNGSYHDTICLHRKTRCLLLPMVKFRFLQNER